MQTASTVQILDANNQNISPATCIDSVYYEYSSGGNTYRMSLRNRIIIAGSGITEINAKSEPEVSGTNNNATLKWPQYFYRLDNAGSNGYIYTLNSEHKNVGAKLAQFINLQYFNQLQAIGNLNSSFLRTDGGNVMFGELQVRLQSDAKLETPSNCSIMISPSTGKIFDFNDTRNGNKKFSIITENFNQDELNYKVNVQCTDSALLSVSTGELDISAHKSFCLTTGESAILAQGKKLILSTSTGSNCFEEVSDYDIVVGDTNKSGMFVKDSSMTIQSINPEVSTIGDINIVGGNSVRIQQEGSAELYLYDIPLINPNPSDNVTYDSSHHYSLKYYNGDRTMKFTKDANLIFISGDDTITYWKPESDRLENDDEIQDLTIYSQTLNIGLESGTYTQYPTFQLSENNINLYTALIRSGEVVKPVISPQQPDSPFIDLATINGQSLLGSNQFNFATTENITNGWKLDFETASTTTTYQILGANSAQRTQLSTVGGQKKMSFNNAVTFNGSGDLYAHVMYQSSDARVKKDITDVEINEYDLPAIRQFRMKDGRDNIRYGYIAQELEKTHPELVDSLSGEGSVKRVDYTSATFLTIAHMQKKMDYMQNEIDELKKLIKQLLKK